MLESIGIGYFIVVVGAIMFFIIKALLGVFAVGTSKLIKEPKPRLSETEKYEALHCKPGEHVYGEVKTKRYSEYNGGTDIRMDEEGRLYLKVYNLKTGESHRLSAKYLYELEDLMTEAFKAMAEREKELDVETKSVQKENIKRKELNDENSSVG